MYEELQSDVVVTFLYLYATQLIDTMKVHKIVTCTPHVSQKFYILSHNS